MTPLVALIAALACYRLALLATADAITEDVRGRVIRWAYTRARHNVPENPKGGSWDTFARKDADPPKLVTLLICPWCVSVYVAAPVAWSAWCFGDRAWWFVPALTLAASGATGFLAEYASPAK